MRFVARDVSEFIKGRASLVRYETDHLMRVYQWDKMCNIAAIVKHAESLMGLSMKTEAEAEAETRYALFAKHFCCADGKEAALQSHNGPRADEQSECTLHCNLRMVACGCQEKACVDQAVSHLRFARTSNGEY